MRLYFAHPVNVFGVKPLEQDMVDLIARHFPNNEIENPNQPHHQEAYARWKKECGNGMRYYFEEMLPSCDGCVSMIFLDGKWGLGVAGEAVFFLKRGQPSYLIVPPKNDTIRELTPDERTRLIDEYDINADIANTHTMDMILGHKETRARTWISMEQYGKEYIPYEQAHMREFIPSEWEK